MNASRGDHLELLVRRVRRFVGMLVTVLGLIGAGYWYTQVLQGEHYRGLADNNRLRRSQIKAPRGLIVDRNGRLLVENVPGYDLVLDRSLTRDLEGSIDFASSLLEVPRDEIAAKVEMVRATPAFRPVVVASDLTLQEVARVEVSSLEHPEFQVAVVQRRLYRNGPQTAHLLGYLSEITREELSSLGLTAGELVGRDGVEQAYDFRLRGENGDLEAVVDSRGRLVSEHSRKPARSGEQLRLDHRPAICKRRQPTCCGIRWVRWSRSIRGMERSARWCPCRALTPTLFISGLTPGDWDQLVRAPGKPLQNRAIQNTYPPGSVFKMVMGVAGLSEACDVTWQGGVLQRFHPVVRAYEAVLARWRTWLGQSP